MAKRRIAMLRPGEPVERTGRAAHKTAKKRVAKQSATTLSNAVRRAEKGLRQPGENEARVIDVRPQDVETRTELFQPRMLTHSNREVDAKHVRKLSKLIGNIGELNPIVIVSIDGRWVCLDGHHRLAAYTGRRWEGTIKANWFAGTVREAVAESKQLNQVYKLEMTPEDNRASAWQQTVLGWRGSTAVARENNVSLRLAQHMKEVKEAYNREGAIRERMRLDIERLEDVSWGAARAAYLDHKPGPERTLQDKAATLAKQLANKMTDLLSRDPEVTALALKLYDRDLVSPLTTSLQKLVPTIGVDDDDEGLELPTVPRAWIREMTDKQLMESHEEIQDTRAYLARKSVDIEREQDRRAGPPVPFEPLDLGDLELTEEAPAT